MKHIATLTHTDSQGVPLEVGQVVAYNWSGQVVPGIIEGLTPKMIFIRSSHRYYDNKLSRIRDGQSVLVFASRRLTLKEFEQFFGNLPKDGEG